ncbi:sensor histidine kinase [Ectobacillus funiculus]|uniref:sensor histidine kinase n=1 Tax=Ectobacillus funiculus TaxID=137993 RepID=UPI0039795674
MIPRWTIFVFVPFSLIQLASVMLPDTIFDLLNWSSNGRLIYYLTMIIVTIYSQMFRYRKISTSVERQQTKWVVYGVTISLLSSIIISGFFVYPVFGNNPVSYIYLSAFLYTVVSIIPLTLTLAILRHRLWDIDPLVNRTILYGILTLSIILLYSVLVLYLSSLFKTEGNFIISLVATAVVAILFSPIKERMQRIVNRVMKGRHDDPYAVLKELGNHLVKPLAPEEVLKVVAETIKDALRLPYVGISIKVNDVEKLAVVAGKAVFDKHFFAIIHGGEELGRLIVSSRSPEEAFSSEDMRLLDVLLQQSGPIVQNVKMTWGMQLLAHDLQESREKLVLAREEERLQMRRNLHDDLAPRLLSLSFNVAAAEQYIKKSPERAIKLLGDLRGVIRTTVDEIRTMVHDLRPPTLDEFGLLGAIRARIEDVQKTAIQEEKATSTRIHSLQIKLNAPEQFPDLPAAVEVAAYRIITEALVNVVKHAKASQCVINITPNSGGSFIIEVTDDGIGLPAYIKPSGSGGIGLKSIRERTGELGGRCIFEKIETGGTRVKAWLPIS